jgi:hypothetical protein
MVYLHKDVVHLLPDRTFVFSFYLYIQIEVIIEQPYLSIDKKNILLLYNDYSIAFIKYSRSNLYILKPIRIYNILVMTNRY